MIYRQFATSPRLLAFIEELEKTLTNAKDIATFIADYMNLETAKGYGLDVYGQKIGVNRTITSLIYDDKEKIGFEGQLLGNFDQTNFAPLSKTGSYTMIDSVYRRVLQLSYASIATPCVIPAVVKFYNLFYPTSIVEEGLMTVTVTINEPIEYVETLILTNRNYLPIPMGVNLIYNFNSFRQRG